MAHDCTQSMCAFRSTQASSFYSCCTNYTDTSKTAVVFILLQRATMVVWFNVNQPQTSPKNDLEEHTIVGDAGCGTNDQERGQADCEP